MIFIKSACYKMIQVKCKHCFPKEYRIPQATVTCVTNRHYDGIGLDLSGGPIYL